MQPFILHGAPPLGILYNFGLKMGPERTVWFGAKRLEEHFAFLHAICI